ncbi:MAG TPA: 5-carboxymethyl-2-hydroxymuconate Delta-isomerase [Afifellaceae bacterium]|nr:5-carboxymethyl-2-hydroxymuconate Delta-isomerase [Afifellaceae bacterium]
MPHFSIEYSANLEDRIDMPALCETLRQAGVASGVFPLAGIRVRAIRCDHCAIADLDPANAFLDIGVRLRGGRDLETRKRATAEIFAAAEHFLEPCFKAFPFALSLEMRDIDPELAPKRSSITDHMNAKAEKA